MQDLLQGCLWADPRREGRWRSAHSSLAITSLLPAVINLIQVLAACQYGCTAVLYWLWKRPFHVPKNLQPNRTLQEKGRGRKLHADRVLTCSSLCSKSPTEPESVSAVSASHICPLTTRLLFFVSPCAMTDRHTERRAICTGQENAVYPAPEFPNSNHIQQVL